MRTVVIAAGFVVAGLLAVAVLSGTFAPADGGDLGAMPSDRTTTVAPGEYPPGLAASGVTNVSRLLGTHRRSLSSSGYRVAIQRTFRTSDPATNFTTDRQIAATANLATLSLRRTRRTERGSWSTYEVWANGSTALARLDQSGERPRIRSARLGRSPDYYAGVARVGPYLRNGEFDLVAVTSEGEQRLYTLRATGYDTPEGGDDRVLAFTGYLVVTGQGRVRTLQVTLVRSEATDDGRRRVLRTFTYRLIHRGVETVPSPDWARGSESSGLVPGRPDASIHRSSATDRRLP